MRSALVALVGLSLSACVPTIQGGELGKTSGTTDPGPGSTTGDPTTDDTDDTGEPAGPVDADGDGVDSDSDCDDTNSDVYPDADETADGVDNDCDGWVDEVEVCDDGVGALQAAIDGAADGATLLLCPGTWTEQLEVRGRSLRIVGLEGAEVTVVSAGGAGSALTVSRNSVLAVEGLTFQDGVGEIGGVVSCNGASLTLDGVVVANGSAANGGGLGAVDCAIDLAETAVIGNTATEYGGGIFTQRTSGTIQSSVIDANVGAQGGGAFLYDGTINIFDTDITANEATTLDETAWGPGGGGGGLWTSGGEVSGNRIVGNHSAYQAGGGYFYRGRPVVTDNLVEGNTCGEDGAGLYFNVSTARIEGNTFTGNEAADDAGGLRLYFGSSTIEGNTIVGNVAADDGGGAKLSHSEHTFVNNHLEGNRAGDAGGGLELDNDSTHVADSVFIGNQSYRGAGLHNWRTERRFTIEDSQFVDNVATDCGGGLQFDNNPYVVTIRNLWMEGNEADDGAGVCVDRVYRDPEDVGGVELYYQDSHLQLENLFFVDNTAADDGGAVYIRAGIVDIVNVVMAENYGPGVGAISVKGSTVTLNNAILATNTGGPALVVEDTEDGVGSLVVSYTDFYRNSSIAGGLVDPTGSNGNIAEDPRFSSSGDYSLSSDSPCVDAGDPAIRDVDGSRSDMGAFGGPGAP